MNNMPKQISVSLNEHDEGLQSASAGRDKDNEEKKEEANENEDEYNRYARGQTFISMELQLIAMNEKVAELTKEVSELRKQNSELESSKLRLIKNTANAMNDCRQTIKQLIYQINTR